MPLVDVLVVVDCYENLRSCWPDDRVILLVTQASRSFHVQLRKECSLARAMYNAFVEHQGGISLGGLC